MIGCSSYTDNEPESMVITTYTLNEDGTVTFAVYVPKEGIVIP